MAIELQTAIPDTGWRDISSLLGTGWSLAGSSGYLLMRRVGDRVFVVARLESTGESSTLFEIPSRFRPETRYLVWGVALAGSRIVSVGELGQLNQVRTSESVVGFVGFSFSYATRDAWPTSLPGTPA